MIRLDDKYFINADKYQFVLGTVYQSPKTGDKVFKPIGYYVDLVDLIKAHTNMNLRKMISDGRITTTDQLLKTLNWVEEKAVEKLEEINHELYKRDGNDS